MDYKYICENCMREWENPYESHIDYCYKCFGDAVCSTEEKYGELEDIRFFNAIEAVLPDYGDEF